MYWFGRSDFDAAEAWWQRAVEIDPRNSRAHECLRLLNKTSSTGFKTDAVNPFAPSPSSPAAGPIPSPASLVEGLDDRPPGIMEPHRLSTRPTSSQSFPAPASPPSTNDAFDFAARGRRSATTSSGERPPPTGVTRSPWDEGPSRTSVVTIQDSGGFDAVPEPTPLPNLDRDQFFGRAPESREEIVNFLRATGDLPAEVMTPQEPLHRLSEEILFDDPVEVPGSAPLDLSEPEPEPVEQDWGREISAEEIAYEAIVSEHDVAEDEEPTEAGRFPPKAPKEILQEARDRFGLHDFDGVLERLEQLPPDLAQGEEARSLAAEARRNLLKMYESKIGDFEHTPRVVISDEEVIWLNLNHRAGFILSQIDGTVTYEDLVALSGMPRLDTVRILADLLDKKVVG